MMNMYELPTSVEVNGELFKITNKGDFRMVLHCFNILEAEDLTEKEKAISCVLVFYEDFNELEDVLRLGNLQEFINAMFKWMDAGQEKTDKKSPKLIDWEQDSLLISSAINKVAGKEIRAEKYLHWWTFISYYMAIGDCALSQIVGIRYKKAKNQKLEKHENKFVQENPQYFNVDYRTLEQKLADDYILNLWNGGNSK